MPHEIDRILMAAGAGPWAIDPEKAREIVAALALRAARGPAEAPARPKAQARAIDGRNGAVHLLHLHGTILPRANMLDAMSGAASLAGFQAEFREAAADTSAAAIVLDIDSPGGRVDLVPETADMIRSARRADRPIIAVANTMAASAAYWIASAADEIVVSPSGVVGSIGVYTMHEDLSEALAAAGIQVSVIAEGPRKAEGHPFGPLGDEAMGAIRAEVRATYDQFTSFVAKARGVPVTTVRADPERSETHFGGGRYYHARRAVQLGMADRVDTLAQTVERKASGRRSTRRADLARRRLSVL